MEAYGMAYHGLVCTYCNVNCTSKLDFQSHLTSYAHQIRMAEVFDQSKNEQHYQHQPHESLMKKQEMHFQPRATERMQHVPADMQNFAQPVSQFYSPFNQNVIPSQLSHQSNSERLNQNEQSNWSNSSVLPASEFIHPVGFSNGNQLNTEPSSRYKEQYTNSMHQPSSDLNTMTQVSSDIGTLQEGKQFESLASTDFSSTDHNTTPGKRRNDDHSTRGAKSTDGFSTRGEKIEHDGNDEDEEMRLLEAEREMLLLENEREKLLEEEKRTILEEMQELQELQEAEMEKQRISEMQQELDLLEEVEGRKQIEIEMEKEVAILRNEIRMEQEKLKGGGSLFSEESKLHGVERGQDMDGHLRGLTSTGHEAKKLQMQTMQGEKELQRVKEEEEVSGQGWTTGKDFQREKLYDKENLPRKEMERKKLMLEMEELHRLALLQRARKFGGPWGNMGQEGSPIEYEDNLKQEGNLSKMGELQELRKEELRKKEEQKEKELQVESRRLLEEENKIKEMEIELELKKLREEHRLQEVELKRKIQELDESMSNRVKRLKEGSSEPEHLTSLNAASKDLDSRTSSDVRDLPAAYREDLMKNNQLDRRMSSGVNRLSEGLSEQYTDEIRTHSVDANSWKQSNAAAKKSTSRRQTRWSDAERKHDATSSFDQRKTFKSTEIFTGSNRHQVLANKDSRSHLPPPQDAQMTAQTAPRSVRKFNISLNTTSVSDKVTVRNLPRNVTISEVTSHFSGFGSIKECKIPMETVSILIFHNASDAERLIKRYNFFPLSDAFKMKECKMRLAPYKVQDEENVMYSREKQKSEEEAVGSVQSSSQSQIPLSISVLNLPLDMVEEQLKDVLEPYGVISDCFIREREGYATFILSYNDQIQSLLKMGHLDINGKKYILLETSQVFVKLKKLQRVVDRREQTIQSKDKGSRKQERNEHIVASRDRRKDTAERNEHSVTSRDRRKDTAVEEECVPTKIILTSMPPIVTSLPYPKECLKKMFSSFGEVENIMYFRLTSKMGEHKAETATISFKDPNSVKNVSAKCSKGGTLVLDGDHYIVEFPRK